MTCVFFIWRADNEVLLDSKRFLNNLPQSIVAVVYGLAGAPAAQKAWCPSGQCIADEEHAVKTYAILLDAYNLTTSQVPLLRVNFDSNRMQPLARVVFTNESARASDACRVLGLSCLPHDRLVRYRRWWGQSKRPW